MSNTGKKVAQSTTKNLNDIKRFLYDPSPYINDLYGHEVHLFMHCHMKGNTVIHYDQKCQNQPV